MSVKSRLDKLERDLHSGQCPHEPIHVRWGWDGVGEAPDDAQPEFTPCPCGREQTLLVVEYVDYAQMANG